MATNPYSYGSLGQRWTVGEPTSKSLLDISRVKNDANRWTLEQLIPDPDTTQTLGFDLSFNSSDQRLLQIYNTDASNYFQIFGGQAATPTSDHLVFSTGTNGTIMAFDGLNHWITFHDTAGVQKMYYRGDGSPGLILEPGVGLIVGDDVAVNGDTLFVDASADRVGINTSSADASLHIEGSSVSDLVKVEDTGTDSNPNIQIANDARSYNLQVVGARSDAFEIWDRTAGATRLSISTSGETVFTPSSSSGNLAVKVGSINSDSIRLEAGGTTSTWLESRGYLGHSWYVDSTRSMTLDSTGLGVGTDSPESKLHVETTSGGGVIQIGRDTGAAQYQYINFGGNVAGDDAWQVGRSSNSGGLGGNGAFYIYDLKNSATRLSVDTSGNMGLGGTPVSNGTGSTVLNVNATTGGATVHLTNNTTGTTNSDGSLFVQSGSDLLLINRESGNLKLRTADTDRVTILSSGGMTFNGDTAAANALDDYEEGTYSVTDQSGAGLSFTVNGNRYVKIGKLVWIGIELVFPTTSDTNIVSISLPYAQSTAQRASLSCVTNRSDVTVQGYASTGTARVGIIESAASPVNVTNASLSGKYVIIGGVYEAA